MKQETRQMPEEKRPGQNQAPAVKTAPGWEEKLKAFRAGTSRLVEEAEAIATGAPKELLHEAVQLRAAVSSLAYWGEVLAGEAGK